jgi:hypothetical protein
VHLASFYAGSASQTFIRINDCKVVGLGYRFLDSVFVDSSKDATTTTAAVAHVANSFHDIADGMYKADLFGLVDELKRLFSRNIKRTGRTFKR